MKILRAESRIFNGQVIYDLYYENGKPLTTYLPITRLPTIIANFNIEIIDEGFVYFYDGREERLLPFYKENKVAINSLLNEVIGECILDFSNYLNFIYNLRR